MANLQVDDLPLIPAVDNADMYAAKSNLDYRVRTGEANGLATLDGSGKVPAGQLPTLNFLPLTGGTLTGNLLIANDQNARTGLAISNFTTGTAASADVLFSASGGSPFGKVGVHATGHTVLADSFVVGTVTTKPVNLMYNNTSRMLLDSNVRVNSHLGIGTDPIAAPSIGNATSGSNNLIQYNAGNIRHVLLSDGPGRTHDIGFGAAGIAVFDAGITWNSTTRNLSFQAGGAIKGAFDQTGNFNAVGSITTGTNMFANTNFVSTNPNTVLATSSAGTIRLRPNGAGNAAGEFVVASDGAVTSSYEFRAPLTFTSTGANAVFSTGSAGNVLLRPNGAGSGTGQMIVEASGTVTSAARFISSAGYYIGVSTHVVLSAADNGGTATMYFRPYGPDNSTNQATMGATGNFSAVNLTAYSDLRLKNVIGTVAPRDFSTLDIIEWTWKDDGEYGIGVGAQSVKAIAKEYVHESNDGTLSVDKGGLALEWAASLEKKIKMLEARLRDLEERLA